MFKVDFSRIKGQESALRTLSRTVLSGDYAPLYLFVGPSGVGKATAALEFAKAANCRSKTVRPCGKCQQCHKIERFVHPDVIFLMPGKPEEIAKLERRPGEVRPEGLNMGREISIKQVRELQYELSKPPVEARRRFVIILNGENLSLEAQNSFLKTLEEPPSSTTFVMVSSNPELILPTIRSRARQIKFNPLKFDDFAPFFEIEPEQLKVLWHISGGSVGMARTLMENNLLELRKPIIEVMSSRDINLLMELSGSFTSSRNAAFDFVLMFGMLLRDILLAREGMDDLISNVDLKDRIQDASRVISWKAIEDAFKALRKVQEGLNRNVSLQNMYFTLFRPFYRDFEAVVV